MQIPITKTVYDRSAKFNKTISDGLPTRVLKETPANQSRFTKRKKAK
jgi:hypothetical protein